MSIERVSRSSFTRFWLRVSGFKRLFPGNLIRGTRNQKRQASGTLCEASPGRFRRCVQQRRAYGYWDKEYLRIKILTACFHAPHHISDSSLTVELNRLFIATIVQPRSRNAPHPFVDTAAHDAAVSTRKSRRFL